MDLIERLKEMVIDFRAKGEEGVRHGGYMNSYSRTRGLTWHAAADSLEDLIRNVEAEPDCNDGS